MRTYQHRQIILMVFFLLLGFIPHPLPAGEYDFDPAETEEKPYHFGGYLEFRPILNGLDRNAALYRVEFRIRYYF